MIVCVTYSIQQEVEIDDKFNEDWESLPFEEQDKFLEDVYDAVDKKLPFGAEISCIENDDTILFEE